MATILRADGTAVKLKGDKPNGSLSLKQMQEAVGGLIQPVDFPIIQDGQVVGYKTGLIANEEGLLLGLPINYAGTQMYRQAFKPVEADLLCNLEDLGVVGDVIIPDKDEDGEWY